MASNASANWPRVISYFPIAKAVAMVTETGLPPGPDVSSSSSWRPGSVPGDPIRNVAAGSTAVFGVMVESHLQAGAQKFAAGKDLKSKLK